MFIEIATHGAITGSFAAYENRHKIIEMWDKCRYWMKNGTLRIAVLGPGGVGKTTLSQFLADPEKKLPPEKYKESLGVERIELPGGIVAELLTAPGQAHRREAGWDQVLEEVEGCKKFVVVHVSSYGFHSTPLPMKSLRQANEGTSAAVSRYLGDCRAKEIESLAEIVERLKKARLPISMISLVTKQDLWWDSKEGVSKHYQEGEYATLIGKLSEAHKAIGFRHEYCSASLHSQNFSAGEGEIIRKTVAGYDDALKYAHQMRLLQAITEFVNPT